MASFLGSNSKKTIFENRQPNNVKHLLSGLNKLLTGIFRSLGSVPGDLRVAHCSHFSDRILSPISFFSPLTGISARGPQGRSDMALRPDSHFGPISSLVSRYLPYFGMGDHEKTILLCPPSLILTPNSDPTCIPLLLGRGGAGENIRSRGIDRPIKTQPLRA